VVSPIEPLVRDQDVHHFNTITKIDDQVDLLAHNGPSQIFFFHYPSLELRFVRPLGVQAHNIFSVDGSLATCSSGEGRLLAESGWQLRAGRFPHGIRRLRWYSARGSISGRPSTTPKFR
jgi:hypothetical protein